MTKRPKCGTCGELKWEIGDIPVEVWICNNCDQYPWIVQSMTEQEVMNQDAKASKIARDYR